MTNRVTRKNRARADKTLKENRERNDSLTRERRYESDVSLRKNRERNDEIASHRRDLRDANGSRAFAVFLVVFIVLVVAATIFVLV
jgi:hypothetical protein